MNVLYLIELCFSIFILKINGYVLLAANLDDFRSIAKRFVPEKLAQQLTDMASETRSQNEQQDPKNVRNGEVYYGDNEEKNIEQEETYDSNEKNDYDMKQNEEVTISYKSKDTTPVINIDDIVEKVKQRLEEDYRLKLRNAAKTSNKKYASDGKISEKYETNDSGHKYDTDYDDRKPDKNVKKAQYVVSESHREPSPKQGKTPKRPDRQKNIQNGYENGDIEGKSDETVYNQPKETDPMIFDAMDLLNSKDSYEDYATPKKFQVYEIKETSALPKRFNVKSKVDGTQKFANVQHSLAKDVNIKLSDYDYDVTGESKAKTEDLMYDEKDIRTAEEVSKVTVENGPKAVTKKSKAGTMINTREHFKMSSPNYYAKLPILAERYDFNEPIPERDREPEDLRPIGNPPARINHKVKWS